MKRGDINQISAKGSSPVNSQLRLKMIILMINIDPALLSQHLTMIKKAFVANSDSCIHMTGLFKAPVHI